MPSTRGHVGTVTYAAKPRGGTLARGHGEMTALKGRPETG